MITVVDSGSDIHLNVLRFQNTYSTNAPIHGNFVLIFHVFPSQIQVVTILLILSF